MVTQFIVDLSNNNSFPKTSDTGSVSLHKSADPAAEPVFKQFISGQTQHAHVCSASKQVSHLSI